MPVPFFNQLVVCDPSQQPAIDQDFCDPTVLLSTIQQAAIGNPQGAPFNDITDATELMQRLSQSNVDDDSIRIFTCAGEKAAPEQTTITIDNRRTIVVQEKNTLTLTITDLSPSVFAMSDYYKKHRIQKLWFFVIEAGKMLHGGNNGILIEIIAVTNFPSGDYSVATLVLTCTWSWAPQELQMDDYPLQTGAVANTTIPNPTATISGQTNTSLRLNRSGAANANATAYIYQLFTDSARTQAAPSSPQTVPASGNAYADFTGLTAGTTYYGRIVPVPATGYTAGSGGVVSGATTNTTGYRVFIMPANSVTALPTLSQINAGTLVNAPAHGPVVADWADGGGPARPTIAMPVGTFVLTNADWTDTGNPSNTGPVGSSTAGQAPSQNVFDFIGVVSGYNIAQTTSDTDFDGTTVSFTE